MITLKFGNWSFGFGAEEKKLSSPLAVVILDGWGYSPRTEANAIALAHTPNYDRICSEFPKTYLNAAGASIGVAENLPGNAEIGHLTIGAGRVVDTDAGRIQRAVSHGDFSESVALCEAFEKARETNATVHLIGLVSDGDIQSSTTTLFALIRMAKNYGLTDVVLHSILDGRDVMPRTADIYTEAVEIKMADIGIGKIATVCGRYYAMDDEGHWDRTARAYTMLVHAEGERTRDAVTAIRGSFLRGISDEFIAPVVVEDEEGIPIATVKNGDIVIFFNHRGEQMRQLVRSLAIIDTRESMEVAKPETHAVCMTQYDTSFKLPVAFPPEAEENVLSQMLSGNGRLNYRVTESERLAHLTYFLNGGTTHEFANERRIIVPSPKPELRHFAPEMASFKVTDRFMGAVDESVNDVFFINLPAPDVIAQSGNIAKTIEAVQFVDTCLGGIIEKVSEKKGAAIICSSHGNCEEMVDPVSAELNPNSTKNPVPFHLIGAPGSQKLREGGSLQDIAPTILGILGLDKPDEMTGNDLRLPS